MKQVVRLKGPVEPLPSVTLSSTLEQSGSCHNQRTSDLLLTFKVTPQLWLEKLPAALSEVPPERGGPCEFSGRPLGDGRFEVRLSYLATKEKMDLKTLVFTTSDSVVVDHWLETPQAARFRQSRSAAKTARDDGSASEAKLAGGQVKSAHSGVLDVVESNEDWDKALGSKVVAFDLNTPELDRFRFAKPETQSSLSAETIERRKLALPYLDLPSLDLPVSFAEMELKLKDFTELNLDKKYVGPKSKEVKRLVQGALEGMNYVVLLAKQESWVKAQSALAILESSRMAKALPTDDASWWALKGLINVKMGQTQASPAFVRRGLDAWRDAVRLNAGRGGVDQEYIEYMLAESTRLLFGQNLPYAAASMLSWAQRYQWSPRLEERFAYLRADAYFQLGLYEDSKKVFEKFYAQREALPVNASIDRRLVPAAAFRMGDAEFRVGHFEEARQQYTKALLTVPTASKFAFEGEWLPDEVRLFPHVLFNRAEASLRTGFEQSALKDYRAFLFITPSHPKAGLVMFRIGEILRSQGAPDEMVMNAWRECVFRVPDTLGARLCQARKSAREIETSDKTAWPRIIGQVEDARPRKGKDDTEGTSPDELEAYLALVLADTFVKVNEPRQALFRLDPLDKLNLSPYMRAWADEYAYTSFAGALAMSVREGKYKQVVSDYDKRRRTLLYRQTRPEILWRVAQAYRGLSLWKEAYQVLNEADRIRQTIGKHETRPYEPAPQEWIDARVDIGLEMLKDGKLAKEVVADSMKGLDLTKAVNLRRWIRFAQFTQSVDLEVSNFRNLEKIDSLSWEELRRYSNDLKKLALAGERVELLEKSVGTWFAEKEKVNPRELFPGGADLLRDLAEIRGESNRREAALSIYDYLTRVERSKLGSQVTPAMILYKRGLLLREMSRNDDARQSFEQAKRLEANSIWAGLSSSAQKDMDAAQPPSKTR